MKLAYIKVQNKLTKETMGYTKIQRGAQTQTDMQRRRSYKSSQAIASRIDISLKVVGLRSK